MYLVSVQSQRRAAEVLPAQVWKRVLVIHAWSGCDTTSATFGHGKTTLLKTTQDLSDIVGGHDKSQEEVSNAGLGLFRCMYGANAHDTLTSLRYARYMQVVAKGSTTEPQRPPSTERAAYFHSLHVHLQVVRWRTVNNDELDHNAWGWKKENGSVCPTMTDLDAAPSKVLNLSHCKCK